MFKQAHAVLPAADLGRFRSFYHDKLGLDPSTDLNGMLLYGNGSWAFEVYETPNAGTAKNTQMTWITDDLDGDMARLRESGVEFLEFDEPGIRTDHGVATGDPGRIAWFQDSEGNILALAELATGITLPG